MKKTFIFLISSILTAYFSFAAGALELQTAENGAEPGAADEPALSYSLGTADYTAEIALDRTVYFLGGEFSISYTNSQYDKDWIILVPTRTMTSDSVTDTTPYENYFYVKENGDGIVSFPEDRKWNDDIISGEYLAVMLQNNGYTQCSNEVYFRAIDRDCV